MTTLSYGLPGGIDDLIVLPAERAAQLAQVTMRQIWYWNAKHLVTPSIRRESVRLYAFDDLIALLTAAMLRQRGYSLQRIRKVVQHLRSRGYGAPLNQLKFATLGKHEIYFQHPDGSWEGDLEPDQTAIAMVLDLEMIKTIIREGVARVADDAGKLERKRGRVGRKIVFKGTRIPVDVVTRRLGLGQSEKQIIAAFPDLTAEDIAAAREHVQSV